MSEKSVIVKKYLNETEANIAKGLLESCGIPVVIVTDNCGGMRRHLNYASPVRLMVSSSDKEEALKLLLGK